MMGHKNKNRHSSRQRRAGGNKNDSRSMMKMMLWSGAFILLLANCLSSVSARAILGIDLGSTYMKVALVRPGSPLEIVTNLHSKRKTENLILFDNNVRLYGADAAALLARKSTQTAAHVSLALGRDEDHVVAKVLQDRHHPVFPRYNETRNGTSLPIVGDAKTPNQLDHFTPEELTAMVLQHAHEIAVQYAAAAGGAELTTIRDCVITVPSFLTDPERRSYLDAAALANMNVLVLMDETVAAAVQYAMDKTFSDGPVTMLFYNMGAVSTQVAIVKFEANESSKKPVVTVLAKAWDETLGGAAFDHVIVEYVVEQYNKKRNTNTTNGSSFDIRTDRPAMTKLRIEANKIKHVLSANTESAVHFSHDDVSLSLTISRSKFQELCHDLLRRVNPPVATALQRANITNVDAVELLGGGVRVPAVTDQLATILPPPMELGKHMNADEAFALGSAFVGANASTAFRVRNIGLIDIHPYDIDVQIDNLNDKTVPTTTTTGESSFNDEPATAAAVWSKSATIFKTWGKTGVKKTIAFSHDQNVMVELLYNEGNISLERYNITGIDTFAESKKDIGKPKVSLQFELSTSGITRLIKAEAILEETYTVEEELEVEDDDDEKVENAGTKDAETKDDKKEKTKDEVKEEKTKDGDSADATNATDAANATAKEKETPKKKMKKVKVEKEKKRTHKQPLMIERYYVGRIQPHSPALLAESKLKLEEMDRVDKERTQLEESRNKVESFIYKLKNELVDRAEEIEKFTNEKQRKELTKLSEEAESWLDDIGYKADRATSEDKYAELHTPYQKIMLRITESTARPAAMEKLRKKLEDVEKLMEKWVETKPQVTEEERKSILDQLKKIQKWADDNEKKQDKKKPHEDLVFLSTDIPSQFTALERAVVKLGKKPKPKVTVEKKENVTDSNSTTTSNATDDSTATDKADKESSSASDETDSNKASADETKAKDAKASEASSSKDENMDSVKAEL